MHFTLFCLFLELVRMIWVFVWFFFLLFFWGGGVAVIYLLTEVLNRHVDFRKAKINRYIELCNPFPRVENPLSQIIKSFPQFKHFVFSNCNSFPRFQRSRIAFRSLDFNIHNGLSKSREWIILQSEITSCLIWGNGLQHDRTDCLIRGNESPIRWNELLIRENGLHYLLMSSFLFLENLHVPSGLSYQSD